VRILMLFLSSQTRGCFGGPFLRDRVSPGTRSPFFSPCRTTGTGLLLSASPFSASTTGHHIGGKYAGAREMGYEVLAAHR
jgi:hypothetical protein